jgi:hypothetical protein
MDYRLAQYYWAEGDVLLNIKEYEEGQYGTLLEDMNKISYTIDSYYYKVMVAARFIVDAINLFLLLDQKGVTPKLGLGRTIEILYGIVIECNPHLSWENLGCNYV